MQIGNVTPRNPYFLAPMAGITDWPFRVLCVEQGAGLVYTEMVNARALHHQDPETLRIAQTHEAERPCAVQIFGHEPDMAAEAVRYFLTRPDICLVDINMGCPAPKIVKNGDGCALMCKPDLARAILKAAVDAAAGRKPVTVKFRKGWTADALNYLDFGRMAQDAGVSAVTLHGRTREQYYSGEADRGSIRQLKEALDIPVIGNGDVRSLADADSMMRETGCDAVMIGRGAQGNPWVFRCEAGERPARGGRMDDGQTQEVLPGTGHDRHLELLSRGDPDVITRTHQAAFPHVDPDVLRQTIRRHYDMLSAYKGERTALLEMRKHVAWYLHGWPGAAHLRAEVYRMETREAVERVLEGLGV